MTRFATSTALALCVGTSPAFADVTANQVWSRLDAALSEFGYTVTATQSPSANGLDVTDISIALDMPEDAGTVAVTVDEIALTENGDGTVTMTMSPTIPIDVVAQFPDGEAQRTLLNYNNGDLEVVISGDPQDLTYTYTASEVSVSLVDMMEDGTSIITDDMRFLMAMSGLNGTAMIKDMPGQATEITQNGDLAQISYDIAMPDEDTGAIASVNGALQSVSISSTSALPEGFSPNEPESMALDGFAATAEVRYTSGATTFAFPDETGTTTGASQSTDGVLSLTAADGSATYDISAQNVSYAITSPEVPLPLNAGMSEVGFRITLPTAPSDAPTDVGLGLTFAGITLSETIWNMLDPSEALPRDPATLLLDISGLVTPNAAFLEPESMVAGEVPGELNALTLNDLQVAAAGAKLTGAGDFTFDNSDLQTFGGMPRPNGSVTFNIAGANALIDKLIAMGMLTSEDAMGARMMMSMFAVPGEDPDTLTATITVNEQGHVLANGMRIQ